MNGLSPSYCDADVVDPYKDVVSKSAISFSKTLFKVSLANEIHTLMQVIYHQDNYIQKVEMEQLQIPSLHDD